MTRQSLPVWYWIISALLMLWSLSGVGAFASQVSMGPAQIAALPVAQRDAFTAMPIWVWAAYGVATIGSLAASICLLLRRAWAVPLYALSLLAVVIQFGWSFGVAKLLDYMPPQEALPLPIAIFTIGLISFLFARFSVRRAWLA